MGSLHYRDLQFVLKPVPPGEYKLVWVGRTFLAVYKTGQIWDLKRCCWCHPYVDADGYHCLQFGGSSTKLHRLILYVFKGQCKQGIQGRHLDGNPANNNIKNLEWGTPKQNWDDRRRHGRVGKHYGARQKCSSEKAATIREFVKKNGRYKGYRQKLRGQLGITNAIISNVLRNLSWKD